MELLLSDTEIRILGCLIEKEMATPEYYPLSLNALTNACNQKSNRQPVINLAETEVVRALDSLRTQGLAMQSAEGVRVPRYRHTLAEKLHLEPAQLAVLAELLLRGPQTLGELRARAERMYPLADLAAVEEVLTELAEHSPPLAVQLPRRPGHKENRFAHLLAGPADLEAEERALAPEGARAQVMAVDDRIARLEEEVVGLREELAQLRQSMEDFRAQFE
ncbi:YceH family protein [Geoalkalibacter halelectricus]|uniref:YceH family protein n=1 Tax=Geoalkalibacter halelectricus TaxID=2847045 RepID=A0ABY5ZMI4_9BACT|nr:YceH family protein [Geoalkalibacter halelectricus]MDO3378932.1 YceH family protein [Geoalkalibacter halelectricus]UWZ79045.1 YceH family protein [Geoalkalibacter halelectricus]